MKTFYLLALIVLASCADHSSKEQSKVFVQPDHIDHYRLAINDKALSAIFKNENISNSERRLAEILHHNDPTSIADSLFISEMEAMPYFTKTKVDKKLAQKIMHSFVAEETLMSASIGITMTLCAPTYRDILVFRNHSKIVGMAKVCFACNHVHLVGNETKSVEVKYDLLRKALSKPGGN
jgi:hypothetical protein